MSATKLISENRVFWLISEASRLNGKNFKTISLSRKLSPEIPAYQKWVYLIHNPPINFRIARWQKKFCWLFLLSGPAFKISFLISLPVNSTKCLVMKIKKWNSKPAFFPLTLSLFEGNNRGTNMNVNGGYFVKTTRCTTCHKVANRVARKVMGGL